tara:strand:+ start:1271 stop:1882 length:612 start_codon:yes stop_codon:yes gene_type:complete
MEEQEKYANFSKAAYSLYNPLQSKATNQQTSLKILEDADIKGYRLHPSSSNKRGVYINDNTKDIVIAHKGTTATSKANILSDVNIAIGLQNTTERFKKAVRQDAKIKNAFPEYNITLTGHSLGGNIGTNSATKNNMKGVFYNIGSGVPSFSSFLTDRRKINKNIKHYSTNYDIVSIQSKKFPIKQIKVKTKPGLSAHALENFR